MQASDQLGSILPTLPTEILYMIFSVVFRMRKEAVIFLSENCKQWRAALEEWVATSHEWLLVCYEIWSPLRTLSRRWAAYFVHRPHLLSRMRCVREPSFVLTMGHEKLSHEWWPIVGMVRYHPEKKTMWNLELMCLEEWRTCDKSSAIGMEKELFKLGYAGCGSPYREYGGPLGLRNFEVCGGRQEETWYGGFTEGKLSSIQKQPPVKIEDDKESVLIFSHNVQT